MATEKQIAANRRNAQKSTGPRTAEDKAKCKLNALRHGCRAASILLPEESEEDLNALFVALRSEWKPQTATEHILLDQMVVSQWKLRRMERIEDATITIGRSRNMKRDLERAWRQTTRLENSFHRAMRELIKLQKARKEESRAESAARISPQPLANKLRMAPLVTIPCPPPPAPYIMSGHVAPSQPAPVLVRREASPAAPGAAE